MRSWKKPLEVLRHTGLTARAAAFLVLKLGYCREVDSHQERRELLQENRKEASGTKWRLGQRLSAFR